MGEQKVTITATPSKVKQINVTSSLVANQITATPDTSLYYSNLSKQWATKMDGKVVNEDYSSKYYAENSRIYAETAKMEASAANSIGSQLRENFEDYNGQLIEAKNTGIEEIKASVDPVMDEIETVTIVANNIDTVTDIGENLDNILNKTVKVGKTTTSEAGTQASVVNAGTNLNPVLDFTIPRGEKGDNGGMTATYENETLNLFSESGTILNPKWGNITGNISSQADLQNALNNKVNKSEITNFATKTELNTKQPKGNYALVDDIPTLVSELGNDSNYATQTQVLQAIASIPQFKLSIVGTLPATGEKMTLYFVPKEGAGNDIYNEYVWIEETSSFEFLGSTAIDLTDYVKNTDYAGDEAGVIKRSNAYGTALYSGYLIAGESSLEQYKTRQNSYFIGKGTLENVLTQYPTNETVGDIEEILDTINGGNSLLTTKALSISQANYDALETKDANTLYLIEE